MSILHVVKLLRNGLLLTAVTMLLGCGGGSGGGTTPDPTPEPEPMPEPMPEPDPEPVPIPEPSPNTPPVRSYTWTGVPGIGRIAKSAIKMTPAQTSQFYAITEYQGDGIFDKSDDRSHSMKVQRTGCRYYVIPTECTPDDRPFTFFHGDGAASFGPDSQNDYFVAEIKKGSEP